MTHEPRVSPELRRQLDDLVARINALREMGVRCPLRAPAAQERTAASWQLPLPL
jgi:hypothetical protein